MNCPRCDAVCPEVARFCPRCGADLREPAAGARRARRFAAHPGEPLMSFNLVTSLMPLAAGTTPQTYRFALVGGLALPVLAALFGWLPFALAAAAVVVPVVYLVYLYDVNEWEDQPVPVVLWTLALSALLAVPFTLAWNEGILDGPLAFVSRSPGAGIDLNVLLVTAVLVPIGSEVLKNIGPCWLASRPRFDDMIDGLTFGVASGAAFAAVETLVLNRHLLFSGTGAYDNGDGALWISVVLTAGLVKPLVYGSATGIAVASFSGLGEGYDGFTSQYWRGLAEAIVANAALGSGLYLTGRIEGTNGVVLGLLWGLLIAGALLLRVRYLLHTALLEGALEAAQRETAPKWVSGDAAFCGECEMPLLHESSFCIACGTSVRAAPKSLRRTNVTALPAPRSEPGE